MIKKDFKTITYGSLSSLYYQVTHALASQEEVNFYASFIKNKNDKVLEAMSGTGRLLIRLIQQGFCVEGVDYSRAMLEQCKNRCASLQLEPVLYEQSLEQLTLLQQYAVVIIAYGSFQLIADRAFALQALKNLYACMQLDGILLIDFFVPKDFSPAYYEEQVRLNNHSYIKLLRRTSFDTTKKRAYSFCTYILYVDGKPHQYEDELVELAWYTDEELQALIKEAGFVIQIIIMQQFDSPEPSMILVAQKK